MARTRWPYMAKLIVIVALVCADDGGTSRVGARGTRGRDRSRCAADRELVPAMLAWCNQARFGESRCPWSRDFHYNYNCSSDTDTPAEDPNPLLGA